MNVSRIEWLNRQVRRLHRALSKYGEHKPYCGKSGQNPDYDGACGCGLELAKKKRVQGIKIKFNALSGVLKKSYEK